MALHAATASLVKSWDEGFWKRHPPWMDGKSTKSCRQSAELGDLLLLVVARASPSIWQHYRMQGSWSTGGWIRSS